MSKQRQKGTAAETAIVNYLKAMRIRAKRNPLAGSNDVGDIDMTDLPWVATEAKNVSRMDLAGWVTEANKEAENLALRGTARDCVGVVWHKRRGKGSPADWYVTMDGSTWVAILRALCYNQNNLKDTQT